MKSPELEQVSKAANIVLALHPEALADSKNVVARSYSKGLVSKSRKSMTNEGIAVSEVLASVLENELIPLKTRHAFAKDYQATLENKLEQTIEQRAAAYSEKIKADIELWFVQNPNPRLEKNECSRLHKLKECMAEGVSVKFNADLPSSKYDLNCPTFVVRHDWASVLPTDIGNEEWKLPYDRCIFEFKVCGKVFIVLYPERVTFIEMPENVWMTLFKDDSIFEYLDKQVRAVCVSLDAAVTETEVIRQPQALQDKRIKTGKISLSDYHVVDLTRRMRAQRNPNPVPTNIKVRLHWRRGHWRHFVAHRTWINWMLVGNPDLGFIDKEYKL